MISFNLRRDGERPRQLAEKLLKILDRDQEHLQRIDRYLHGKHDDPYMPEAADAEYKLLAKRAVTNWIPLVTSSVAQALYVDGFRQGQERSEENGKRSEVLPEWEHWQRSNLTARQIAIHRSALSYGHAFAVTEKKDRGVVTRGLSPLYTAAVYEDPANDLAPRAALTITRPATEKHRGKATLWDERRVYTVTFTYKYDKIRLSTGRRHGASECPVTRFAASVDLEGRTIGLIAPLIALQDRINQTVFDLLVAQSYASYQVRTVTGMAPPVKRDPETGKPILDENGQEVPADIRLNPRRLLIAKAHDAKFGVLPGTPLDGFIAAIELAIRHLSALAQIPAHYLLGEIANLAADAMIAAETSLARKVEEFRKQFGESWERVFRLAAEIGGNSAALHDWDGEVLWRDMEGRSLAQSADGLGKLAEMLEIPKEGLWPRVPGVTGTEIAEWKRLRDEQDSARQFADATIRAAGSIWDIPSDEGGDDAT